MVIGETDQCGAADISPIYVQELCYPWVVVHLINYYV